LDEETLFLVRFKNRGGLKVHSQSAAQLVQAAEEVFVTGVEESANVTHVLQTKSVELDKLGEEAFNKIAHLVSVLFRGLDATLRQNRSSQKL